MEHLDGEDGETSRIKVQNVMARSPASAPSA
jgi:hypothetical protein